MKVHSIAVCTEACKTQPAWCVVEATERVKSCWHCTTCGEHWVNFPHRVGDLDRACLGKVSSSPSVPDPRRGPVGGDDRALASSSSRPVANVIRFPGPVRSANAHQSASVPPLPAQATASTVERTTGVTERRTGATST